MCNALCQSLGICMLLMMMLVQSCQITILVCALGTAGGQYMLQYMGAYVSANVRSPRGAFPTSSPPRHAPACTHSIMIIFVRVKLCFILPSHGAGIMTVQCAMSASRRTRDAHANPG